MFELERREEEKEEKRKKKRRREKKLIDIFSSDHRFSRSVRLHSSSLSLISPFIPPFRLYFRFFPLFLLLFLSFSHTFSSSFPLIWGFFARLVGSLRFVRFVCGFAALFSPSFLRASSSSSPSSSRCFRSSSIVIRCAPPNLGLILTHFFRSSNSSASFLFPLFLPPLSPSPPSVLFVGNAEIPSFLRPFRLDSLVRKLEKCRLIFCVDVRWKGRRNGCRVEEQSRRR